MGGRMSRNKGKRGERQVIEMLQPVVNEVFSAHGLEPPTLKRNTMQADGGGFDLHGLEWLAIEVKFTEKTGAGTLDSFWRQTLEQCGAKQTPVLFYRGSREDWRVYVWGFLERCGHDTHCVRVAITVDSFLAWFRTRLNYELLKQE